MSLHFVGRGKFAKRVCLVTRLHGFSKMTTKNALRLLSIAFVIIFFFQAEDGIRDDLVTEFRRVLFRSSLFSSPRRRWNAGRDQKSPIRRCFKSRPPLRAGCAGSPPAASHGCKRWRDLQRHPLREMLAARTGDDPRFFIPWRLSGLLSGYLPTDTRPQARAKLGKRGNKTFESASQQFF